LVFIISAIACFGAIPCVKRFSFKRSVAILALPFNVDITTYLLNLTSIRKRQEVTRDVSNSHQVTKSVTN
jgi:hypothetical protein